MRLSQEQINRYEDAGFLLLPEVFSLDEVQALRNESARLLEQDRVVPGSHKAELPLADEQNAYILETDVVEPVLLANGIVTAEGPIGSLLFFHGNLVHGSGGNISPYPRRIVYASYCAVSNHIQNPTRPEWIAERDFEPIEPMPPEHLRRLLGTTQPA